MEFEQQRQTVIDAGKRLALSGLIARTWGNVSCRINDDLFAVTPSGRAYETLLPEEIVLVNIKDLRYQGEIRPSSETRIHAEVYRLKSDINFVIHTHQMNASVLSTLTDFQKDVASLNVLGEGLVFAAYGLPGSKKLCKGVVDALEKSEGKAIIMSHHGALCMGRDADEAFEVALKLENTCQSWILEKRKNYESFQINRPAHYLYNSERMVSGLKILGQAEEEKNSPAEQIHEIIYKDRSDINYIRYSCDPEILRAAARGITMKPLLDDMAQIVGTSLKTAIWAPKDPIKSGAAILEALKGRHALLIKDCGALCCGETKKDAEAVQLIMEKECKASNMAELMGGGNKISPADCYVMRVNYLKNYSKKA